MRRKAVAAAAVVLSHALILSASAQSKRLGVLISDPNEANGTNLQQDFKTPPLTDSQTLQIKIAKDYWIGPGDPPVTNWRGSMMFIHVLDGSELNFIQLATPDNLYKVSAPPGLPPGSPITTSTPGTPVKWPLPIETIPLTISFFPSLTKDGGKIPSSGITWDQVNKHTFPIASLHFHAKNTTPANNSDVDIIAQAFNIFHGKAGPLTCCHIQESDYLWVPQGFQLFSNCCVPHPGPGCDDPGCAQTVCNFNFPQNLYCCQTGQSNWDQNCANLAQQLCGPLCQQPHFPDPQLFAPPGDPNATGHWTHWEFPPQTVPASNYWAEACGTVAIGIEHTQGPPCPWDCALPHNKQVDVVDFLALLAGWGLPGPCDFDGGGVSVTDFLKLLGAWGPCPTPSNDECGGATTIARTNPEGIDKEKFEMYGATASAEPYKCLPGPPIHKDIWYFLLNATGAKKLVQLSTSVPLFIEVNAGCACPPGPLVACGPGLATVGPFPLQPGECVTVRLINFLDLPNDALEGNLLIENHATSMGADFYTDPAVFAAAVADAGKVTKFTWSFKPDLLPPGGVVGLGDPLDITTHALNVPDPWGTLWPPEVDNVQFSSNTTPPGPLTPRGVFGLAYAKAGFLPELTNNVLLANVDVDSFDIISGPPAGDNHTAIALELISADLDGIPEPALFHVTVYDKAGVELGKIEISAMQFDKIFLGILSTVTTIGRIDVWDELGGFEGISSITAFVESPFGCPGAGGDCCAPHGTPGCSDIDCCSRVCAIDPFCCDIAWDLICVGEASTFPQCNCCPVVCGLSADLVEGEACGADTNGGCNSVPPVFTPAACGDTFCGTAWAAGGVRDTDWYLVTLPDPDGDGVEELRATLVSEFSGVCFIVDIGLPGCAPVVVGKIGCSAACAPLNDAAACLPPGTYAVFVATGDCLGGGGFDGVPCGTTNDYDLAITCGPCPPAAPGKPIEGIDLSTEVKH